LTECVLTLPNPKYVKNHTGHISNPNTCLDSPTLNYSCSRLIKWIVQRKMGSEWRWFIKQNDWCLVVSWFARENLWSHCLALQGKREGECRVYQRS
jgi:hypothetical protein